MHNRSHGFYLAAPKPLKVRERSGIGLAATFETHSDRRYATGFGAQRVLFKRQQMMRERLRSPKNTLAVEMLGVVVCCAGLPGARDANARIVVEPPCLLLIAYFLQAAFQIAHVFDRCQGSRANRKNIFNF